MKLQRYVVLVADPGHPEDPEHATEHTVTILHGDKLRAELEGPRNGIPQIDKAAMHAVTLWIWAALIRTHVIDVPFQMFLPRMLEFEDPDQDAEETGLEVPKADPTAPAVPTAPPLSSPSTSEASTAGSPSTETTG